MKKLSTILLLLLSFTVAIGFSANCNANTVRGLPSCGTWVKDRTERDKDLFSSAMDETWVLGYLSGLNLYEPRDLLHPIDANSINLWMDNFCNSNPLKDVADGAEALISELRKKARHG